MSQKINLSEKQKQIVYAGDGPLLVKASAGSGKTRVLTERIRYLSKKTNRKFLAVTFANKAAEEMKERLKDITKLQNRLFTGTFHGYCQYVLENHGNLVGLSKMPHIFEEESDRLKLIEKAIQQTPSYNSDYRNQNRKEQRDSCYRALEFISRVKREIIYDEDLFNESEDTNIGLLYNSYQDILMSQNAIDFDDLLLLTYNLFIEHDKISSLFRRTYQYICIDEAQDLNNAQYKVLLAITKGEHKNVMLVGDPNQSIFAFNGSSPDFMTVNFVEDFNPEIIELKENYRSSKAVLRAAEKIIPGSSDIINTVIEGIFEMHKLADEKQEAEWIYDKIMELINIGKHENIEGNITHENIAVLARNKYIFNTLEKILSENDTPFYYKMTPGALKFESDAMKIFDMALRVRLNQRDTLHWNRLLDLLNIDINKANNLQSIVKIMESGINKQVLETVVSLNDDGSNIKSYLGGLKELLNNNLTNIDEDEQMMVYNDIDAILNHWHNYAKKTDKKSLHHFRNAMALGQTHPLTQHNGITLSTVHTMKGQEFDIIILMGMDDETFPDYRAIRSGGVEMTQEKNNLYVAFTRAKRFRNRSGRLSKEGGYG